MKSNSDKEKINVFISSRCGQGKYDKVRAGLKQCIEKTGLASVYLFETEPASTQSSKQDYLYSLDDSDVCIFLIDNADNVPDGVLQEITRAKAKSKKSIFLFCDENQLEPTQIQKELIGSQGIKYKIVHSFDDFIENAYRSLEYDLIKIYKHYCKGRLKDEEFDKDNRPIYETGNISSISIDKSLIRDLDLTKKSFSTLIINFEYEVKNSSKFDVVCNEFLEVVLGNRKIRQFNTSLLLEELNNLQRNELYKVVEIRWKAILAYWEGYVDKAINYEQESLNLAKTLSLPTWFINDILIDLRNLHMLKGTVENFFGGNEAQNILDESKEALYYPLLDRYENEFNSSIISVVYNSKTASIYSTTFGNDINSHTDLISNIFAIAVFNGSLTHILLTYDRLKKLAFALCDNYDNWEFKILLIKFSVMVKPSIDIEKIVNTYNEIMGKMNSADALSIYHMADSIPIEHERVIAKLETFSHISYYFSENDYLIITNELLTFIRYWLNNDKKVIAIGNHIFSALNHNVSHIDKNEITKICLEILSSGSKRWYDDTFKLIAKMGIKGIDATLSSRLISEMITIIKEKEQDKYNYLKIAIIGLRKSSYELTSDLDSCVEDNMGTFYNSDYSLETMPMIPEESENHIRRYVTEIKLRNKAQGRNGIHVRYVSYPYQTIINIIKKTQLEVNDRIIEEITSASIETILEPNLYIEEKIDAIQLIIYLKNYCSKSNYNFENFLPSLFNKYETLENETETDFISKFTTFTLRTNLLLLKLCFNRATQNQILEILSEYNNQDDFEKLQFLRAISNIMENGYVSTMSESVRIIFLNYVLGLCHASNHDVRFRAVEAIINMVTSDTAQIILSTLSKMMDYDSLYIKLLILRKIEFLQRYDLKITDFIKQKARIDNNFLIREYARNFASNLEI